jgi:hypothetical protein
MSIRTDGTYPSFQETASSSSSFNDYNPGTTHTVAVSFVPTSSVPTQIGTLTASVGTDIGAGTTGAINYSFTANDAVLSGLQDGAPALQEQFAVNVASSYGSTATETVNVSISRFNTTQFSLAPTAAKSMFIAQSPYSWDPPVMAAPPWALSFPLSR